jgi:hypothetical protein
MNDAEPLELVRREWLRRVEAEYGSAVLTHHLTLWLLKVAAPFELVRLGLSIVEDEMSHAELSQAVYVAAGGGNTARLDRDRLGLAEAAGEPLERAITRVGLETFCLGETVAVRLFARLRRPCEEPVALAALDRILADEVKHRDFGWTLLEWLLSTPHGPDLQHLAVQLLPSMFARLQLSYAYAGRATISGSAATRAASAEGEPALARWGLMPAADYAAALLETLERDYVPRFAEHGIDARAAWQRAKPDPQMA